MFTFPVTHQHTNERTLCICVSNSVERISFLMKHFIWFLLLEDNDVPVHKLIQGLVQRDIIVLYPLG